MIELFFEDEDFWYICLVVWVRKDKIQVEKFFQRGQVFTVLFDALIIDVIADFEAEVTT